MFIYAERLRDRVDCARDIHGGTYAPRPADLLVDGKPLCIEHHLAALPIAPEVAC